MTPQDHTEPLPEITWAKGTQLFSQNGTPYLDFSALMHPLGHSHALWLDALLTQALTLDSTAPLGQSDSVCALQGMLCDTTGLPNLQWTHGGAEAKHQVIAHLQKNAPSGGEIWWIGKGTYPSFGLRAMPADMDVLHSALHAKVSAVVLALFSFEDTLEARSLDFVQALAIFTAEHRLPLVLDECHTCGGVFGTVFAYERYGILPDALLFSERLAGGLPLGGVLYTERFPPFAQSTQPHPLCVATARAVLSQLSPQLLHGAEKLGETLRKQIDTLGKFSPVRGCGLLTGLPLPQASQRDTLHRKLYRAGLLSLQSTGGLLLLPPLTVQTHEIEQAADILKRSLEKGD